MAIAEFNSRLVSLLSTRRMSLQIVRYSTTIPRPRMSGVASKTRPSSFTNDFSPPIPRKPKTCLPKGVSRKTGGLPSLKAKPAYWRHSIGSRTRLVSVGVFCSVPTGRCFKNSRSSYNCPSRAAIELKILDGFGHRRRFPRKLASQSTTAPCELRPEFELELAATLVCGRISGFSGMQRRQYGSSEDFRKQGRHGVPNLMGNVNF